MSNICNFFCSSSNTKTIQCNYCGNHFHFTCRCFLLHIYIKHSPSLFEKESAKYNFDSSKCIYTSKLILNKETHYLECRFCKEKYCTCDKKIFDLHYSKGCSQCKLCGECPISKDHISRCTKTQCPKCLQIIEKSTSAVHSKDCRTCGVCKQVLATPREVTKYCANCFKTFHHCLYNTHKCSCQTCKRQFSLNEFDNHQCVCTICNKTVIWKCFGKHNMEMHQSRPSSLDITSNKINTEKKSMDVGISSRAISAPMNNVNRSDPQKIGQVKIQPSIPDSAAIILGKRNAEQCPKCKKYFSEEQQKLHLIKCTLCEGTIYSCEGITNHQLNICPKTVCPLCRKPVERAGLTPGNKCQYCGKLLLHCESQKAHINEGRCEKYTKCNKCGIYVLTDEKNYKCIFCDTWLSHCDNEAEHFKICNRAEYCKECRNYIQKDKIFERCELCWGIYTHCQKEQHNKDCPITKCEKCGTSVKKKEIKKLCGNCSSEIYHCEYDNHISTCGKIYCNHCKNYITKGEEKKKCNFCNLLIQHCLFEEHEKFEKIKHNGENNIKTKMVYNAATEMDNSIRYNQNSISFAVPTTVYTTNHNSSNNIKTKNANTDCSESSTMQSSFNSFAKQTDQEDVSTKYNQKLSEYDAYYNSNKKQKERVCMLCNEMCQDLINHLENICIYRPFRCLVCNKRIPKICCEDHFKIHNIHF